MERRSSYNYCKRHPIHKQSKGVCPFCLREKLSHISTSHSTSTTNNFNSNSSSTSPLSPSSNKGKEPLKKSRSLAFVMEEEDDDDDDDQDREKKKMKKRKFWSKLTIGKRKEDQLMHSKTMKEKSSTKWAVFS